MSERLRLKVPAFEELAYRQTLLSQPDTMFYNRGYNLGFPEYDNATGCIDFPREKWADWYNRWIGREPERYYAYVVRLEDGAFIGEVDLHLDPQNQWYEMGVVLEAKYRGMGFGQEALALLLKQAFEALGAEAVHNDFEESRTAALKAHLAVGFKRCGGEEGLVELLLTRERYFQSGSAAADKGQIMKKFDESYVLLQEMYQDGYFPDFLVDKVKAEIEKVISCLEAGERDLGKIQAKLDRMTLAINDLQEEFEENDSEIEAVARDSIGLTVKYLLDWFGIDIDIETAIGQRDW